MKRSQHELTAGRHELVSESAASWPLAAAESVAVPTR